MINAIIFNFATSLFRQAYMSLGENAVGARDGFEAETLPDRALECGDDLGRFDQRKARLLKPKPRGADPAVSWRDEWMTIRRGTLVRLVVTGSLILTMLMICTGLIVSAIFGRVPGAFLVALLVLIVVRLAISLFDTANNYVRRRARRRRMQGS
ncbi:MAG: hypothetical protein QOJ91_3092 [Sphingomonadales bacterium]|jgi:hypothetical protein|nr:hypothetical protein [Sphingomonadales bacterium]